MTSVYQKVAFAAAGAALSLGVFSLTNVSSVQASVTPIDTVTTIDFSEAGVGPFSPNFFESKGVIFSEGSSVGFTQGDEALEGLIIAGVFPQSFSNLAVSLAPRFQGTAIYTLSGFDAFSNFLGSVSRELTQDEGDPENTGMGYISLYLELENLVNPATSFTLSNQFVRSSFPQTNVIPFGVNTIQFITTTYPTPVPESSLGGGLLLFAAIGTGLALKKKRISS